MSGATTATFLAIAGVAASAIGTGVAIMGQMQAASAQASAANYNAEVARNNAIAAQQQARQNELIQQQQSRQKIGGITAAYGASGIDSGSGSALDVLGSSAANAELDRQTLVFNGALQAAGYGDEAALDAARAGSAKTAGLTSAAGLLLSGGAKAATAGSSLLSGSSDPTQNLSFNTPNAATLATPD
jgi:hypothetical protein